MKKFFVKIPYSYQQYATLSGYIYAEDDEEAIEIAESLDSIHEEAYEDQDDSGDSNYDFENIDVECVESNVPREAKIQKISELLALSHSITCAINVGKVYIMNDPYQLNIPQVVAACLSIASVIFLETGRNNFIKKFERNNNDLMKDLKDLEEKINIKISNEIILK